MGSSDTNAEYDNLLKDWSRDQETIAGLESELIQMQIERDAARRTAGRARDAHRDACADRDAQADALRDAQVDLAGALGLDITRPIPTMDQLLRDVADAAAARRLASRLRYGLPA